MAIIASTLFAACSSGCNDCENPDNSSQIVKCKVIVEFLDWPYYILNDSGQDERQILLIYFTFYLDGTIFSFNVYNDPRRPGLSRQ